MSGGTERLRGLEVKIRARAYEHEDRELLQLCNELREAALADSPDEKRRDCQCGFYPHQRWCQSAAPAPSSEAGARWTPEGLAKRFHQLYEHLAPKFGYETHKESAVEWEQVPEHNRKLMTTVCAHILKELELERTLAEMPPAEPLSAMGFCEHKRPKGMCPDCGTVERRAEMPPTPTGVHFTKKEHL